MTRTTRSLFRVCLFNQRGCVRGFTWPPLHCHPRGPRLSARACRWCPAVVCVATCGVHLVRPLALYALTLRQINERRTDRIYDLLLDIRGTWRQYRCSASDHEGPRTTPDDRNRSRGKCGRSVYSADSRNDLIIQRRSYFRQLMSNQMASKV